MRSHSPVKKLSPSPRARSACAGSSSEAMPIADHNTTASKCTQTTVSHTA